MTPTERATSLSASERRVALLRAAERHFRRHGLVGAQFKEICVDARVPRQSAYRLFPGGIDSLLDAFHERAVVEVVGCARAMIAALPSEGITFDRAVRAGIEGALEGFKKTPMTQSVLRSDKRLLAGYLLDQRQGSFIDVFSRYAARCAAGFGSKASDLEGLARNFVWDAFQRLLRDVPSDPSVTWPPPSEVLEDPITAFLAAVGLAGEDTAATSLLVPVLEEPRLDSGLVLVGTR